MNRISLAAAAALTALALVPAGASAAPKPSAEILGTVVAKNGGSTAEVTARYVCTEPTHLWVSAKQMADGSRDPRLTGEGSSAIADTYLQQHPTTLVCDGRNHVQTFTIDKTEPGFPDPNVLVGKGLLRKGSAWVQFCMISEHAFVYPTRWAQVR